MSVRQSQSSGPKRCRRSQRETTPFDLVLLDARLPGALSAAQYAADREQTTTPGDEAMLRGERASVFAQAELGSWVRPVLEIAMRARETHVVFNNCYGNYGTTNALEFGEMLLRAVHRTSDQ